MSTPTGIIAVHGNPRGVFKEGTISGTPLPGTLVTKKPGEALGGDGRHTWEPYGASSGIIGADGQRATPAILLEDKHQGKGVDDAYVDGSRCFIYVPLPGEEIRVRVAAAGTGTGDSLAVGDRLIANDGDGLLIATAGSPESEPFEVLEDTDDVTAAGTLVLCEATGL